MVDETDNQALKRKLRIHPKTTIHQYHLWMPIDIYLKLYKIQEKEGCYTHSINQQITKILEKHFKGG